MCQLAVLPHEEVIADGTDLKNYFDMLMRHPDWICRNGFGRPLRGEDYVDFGAEPGETYFPCFTSICMGDSNAVDLAHCTHMDLLERFGC